ncbi:receptor-type tyrosine-protein phosphatase alpha-like [Saccostrea echinata]|uniref:receptor-type tyrosine-protein phosphatase alpha-like n=1 Tax=Saccostrea echinata TaxID=191078 RepID=UPI002A804802|nr:receptor-type tyrosine-protein phosphatase alpha-like [Saccostrea echinata]
MDGRPDSTPDEEDPDPMLLAALFAIIILLLILIILFIRRCMKCRQKSASVVRYVNPVLTVSETQAPLIDDRVTIVLEEIDHSVAPQQDETPEVVVEYCNLKSYRVSLEQFIREVDEKRDKDAFREEFKEIPNGLLELHSAALKKENKSRNRYKKVYPYDYCRVILDTNDNTGSTDYANACFVHGFNHDKEYIAAQGPFTNETLLDFWRLIWQNRCARIVMLTNLFEGDRMKCLQYWPEAEDMHFGPFLVRAESQDVFEQYIIRRIIVEKGGEKKRVTQYHFTAWPDCRVPDDIETLLEFRNLIIHGILPEEGPIVVHCSAGIGRTGTFIALDSLLKEAAAMDSIDVINCVSKLRQQRAFSIQTDMQYAFLHDAIVHAVTHHNLPAPFPIVDGMNPSCG